MRYIYIYYIKCLVSCSGCTRLGIPRECVGCVLQCAMAWLYTMCTSPHQCMWLCLSVCSVWRRMSSTLLLGTIYCVNYRHSFQLYCSAIWPRRAISQFSHAHSHTHTHTPRETIWSSCIPLVRCVCVAQSWLCGMLIAHSSSAQSDIMWQKRANNQCQIRIILTYS